MRFYGSAMPLSAYPGRLPPAAGRRSWQCHKIADGVSIARGRHGRAVRGDAACGQPRRLAAGQAGSGHGLRADRRAVRSSPPARTARARSSPPMSWMACCKLRARSAPTARSMWRTDADAAGGLRRRQGQFRRDVRGLRQRARGSRGAGGRCGRAACSCSSGSAATCRLPQNMVVAKEIEIRGTFRFHEEFGARGRPDQSRRVDVKPLLTRVYPISAKPSKPSRSPATATRR